MWIKASEMLPTANQLVLVYKADGGPYLRYRMETGDAPPDWFDENHVYDDSGLEVIGWTTILDVPNLRG